MKLLVPIVKVSFKSIHIGGQNQHSPTYFHDAPANKKKSQKITITLIVLICVTAGVWVIIKNLTAPAEGSVNQTPPNKHETTDPYSQPGNYSGKYVSFTYLPHYNKVPSKITGNYIEVVNFYSTDHTGKSVSVGISQEDLSQDGSYMLRKKQTNIYQLQPQTRFGICFLSQANGAEYTCFSQHGKYVISVSATSPTGGDVSQDAQSILASLHWKQ